MDQNEFELFIEINDGYWLCNVWTTLKNVSPLGIHNSDGIAVAQKEQYRIELQ